MKPTLYRNPSTFTYLGRHASELRFLLARAKGKSEILDIGPGPFEPFYIAALSPDSKITVLERDPNVLAMIKSIRDGVLLPIREAAMHCVNISDDGTPRKNQDLADERRIEKGIRELRLAGLSRHDFLYNKAEYFGYGRQMNMAIMEPMDISKAVPWKLFDVVFDGLALLNLRKTLGNGDFEGAIRVLLDFTRAGSTIGIATTPAGISGNREYLSIAMQVMGGRMQLQELVVDNLVYSEGLCGGYLATFASGWDSPVDPQGAKSLILSEPLLQGSSIIHPYIDKSRLLALLQDNSLHLIYAIHSGGDYYHACFVDGAFDVPSERYQFRILANLARAIEAGFGKRNQHPE